MNPKTWKESGFRTTAVKALPCGCWRAKLIMCGAGIDLFKALRDELPNAMWSGDWTTFDDLRERLESHLSPDVAKSESA